MPRIFLSYDSPDAQVMPLVRDYLRAHGFEVWTRYDLTYEDSRVAAVEAAICRSWAVIALALAYEYCTEAVYHEGNLALRIGKPTYLIGYSTYHSEPKRLIWADWHSRERVDFPCQMEALLEYCVAFLRRKWTCESSIALL